MKKDLNWLKNGLEWLIKINNMDSSSFSATKREAYNDALDLINQLDESEVSLQVSPVIPQFVADKLEQSKADGINSVGVIFHGALNREYDEFLNNWILNNEKLFVEAFFSYPNIEAEEEPKYIIDLDDEEISDGNHYLKYLEISEDGVNYRVCDSLNAMTFESEEEAQLIAEYVGGRVEELE